MTKTSESTVSTGVAEWAGAIAHDARAKADDTARVEATKRDRLVAYRGAVNALGPAYFERLAAAIGAAAQTFNAAAGGSIVGAPQLTGNGPGFSVRAGEQGFVLVMPYLRTEDRAPTPGCLVRQRIHGRESARPFDFALGETGALLMQCDGELLNAEAFAERMAAPWLRQLDVTQRGY